MCRVLSKRAGALLLVIVIVFSMVAVTMPTAAAYSFPNVDGKTDAQLIDEIMRNENFLLLWYQIAGLVGFDVEANGTWPWDKWADFVTAGGDPQITHEEKTGNYIFSFDEDGGGKRITITFVKPQFKLAAPANYGAVQVTDQGTENILGTQAYENWTDTESSVSSSFATTVRTELSQTSTVSMAHAVGTEVSVSATVGVVDASVSVSYNFTHTTEESTTLGQANETTIGAGTTVTLKPYSFVTVTTSELTTTSKMPYEGKAYLVYDVKIEGDNRNNHEDAINEQYYKDQGLPDNGELMWFGYSDSATAIDDVRGAISVWTGRNVSANNYGGKYAGFTWEDLNANDGTDSQQAEYLKVCLDTLVHYYGEIVAQYNGEYIFTSRVTKQTVSGMRSLLALQDMQLVSDDIQIMEDGWYNITNLVVNTKDSNGNAPYTGFGVLEKKWYVDPDPRLSDYVDASAFYNSLLSSDGTAEIWTNPATGQTYVRGLREGTTYLNLAVLYENPARSFAKTAITTADTMNDLVKVTVIGKPRADNIELKGKIADHYLSSSGAGYEVTFPGELKVSAVDQSGNPYPGLDETNCDWAVWEPNATDFIRITGVSGDSYTANLPGVYYVYAVDPATEAFSNSISFEVFPKPEAKTLILTGEIEDRKMGFGDQPVDIDLTALDVTATDQYNNPFDGLDESNCEWEIYFPQEDGLVASDYYSISGSQITFLRAGSYGVQAKYTDPGTGEAILSEEIVYFAILPAPAPAKISIDEDSLMVKETDTAYDLMSLPITVLDQYGDEIDRALVESGFVFEVKDSSVATVSGSLLTPVFPGTTELTVSCGTLCTSEPITLTVVTPSNPVTINWKDDVGPLYLDGADSVDLTAIALDVRDMRGNSIAYDPGDIVWNIISGHEGPSPVAKLEGALLTGLKAGELKLQAGIRTGNGGNMIFTKSRAVQVLDETPYLARIYIASVDPNGFSYMYLGDSDAFASVFKAYGYDQYGDEVELSAYGPQWSSDSTAIRVSGNGLRFVADFPGTATLTLSATNEKGDEIASNGNIVAVQEKPRLNSLVISGFDAAPQVGGSYDLGELTVSGLDQYGNSFAIQDLGDIAFKISSGATRASINGSTLHFLSNGQAAFVAYMKSDGTITSDPVTFTVGESVLLTKLTLSQPTGMIRVNGGPLDLKSLTVSGFDQKNAAYPIDRSQVTFRIVSGHASLEASVNGSPVDRLYALGDGVITFCAIYNGVESNTVTIVAQKDYISGISQIVLEKLESGDLTANKEYTFANLVKIIAETANGDQTLQYYDGTVSLTGASLTGGVLKTNNTNGSMTVKFTYKNLDGTTVESNTLTFTVSGATGGGAPIGGGDTTIEDPDTPQSGLHEPYIFGHDDGRFGPDDSLTRAQAAVIFYRLVPEEDRTGAAASFPDVKAGDWFYEAVRYLGGTGAISGFPDGTFGPNQTITRAQFAVLAARFMKLEPVPGDTPFADVPADYWGAGYIAAAYKAGYIGGYPDGSFGPEDNVSRAQAVTLINRMLGRAGEKSRFAEADMPFPDVAYIHWAWADIMEAAVVHPEH